MEVKILDASSNATVVQLSWRKFPGIVIQGDSLSILLSQIEYVKKHLGDRDEELLGEIENLYDQLKGLSVHYENVLTKNGIELPY